MTKRFNDYTDAELLTLSNEIINDAIRIEAIQQGIQPPVTLSEAIRKSEWRGYQKPAESFEVYEIILKNEYGNDQTTGLCYLSKERAESALDGAAHVEDDKYGKDKGYKLHNEGASIAVRNIGVSKADQSWAKLQEFTQDMTAFNKVEEICIERLSKARQEDYDRRVNAEKQAEYMRLAGGDEAIAKAFWAKVERNAWPELPVVAPITTQLAEPAVHFEGKSPE